LPLNILHITPDFDLTSGVTRHLLDLLKSFNNDKEYSIHLITNRGDALHLLKNYNVKLNFIPFQKGKKGIFGFLKFKNQIEDYCFANNIKIIHTHHRYAEFAAYYVAKKNELKTITTAHSFVKGFRRLSFKSDKIIAVSNAVKQYLIDSYSIPQEKIVLLYNCVNLPSCSSETAEKFKRNLEIPAENIVLFFNGRICQDKGADILLKAFSKLQDEMSNITLLIVGSDYDKKFQNLSSTHSKQIRIFHPTENITQFYELSDIVVLPSRVDSFPYVMLEAGWFKKPFIGSRTGGMAEFIEDGVNGFICEPGNVDDLTKKIKFVIEHPHKAKAAAEKLYQKVIEDCNCEKYFEKLIQIYNNLLNDK
jgi:glycosyltransferase involved in cell wall biosynthesis